MSIRPGLAERLEWMSRNVYAWYRCGACLNGTWCDNCKESTLKANGGQLPNAWYAAERKLLEEYIANKQGVEMSNER